jgi:hypothetical protein
MKLAQTEREYGDMQAIPRQRKAFLPGFVCGLLVGAIATGTAWFLVEGRSGLSCALPSSLQSPKNRIVGKWVSSRNEKQTLEFSKDGTFIAVGKGLMGEGETLGGRYRWMDETRIVATMSGFYALAGDVVFAVEFQDDQLILTDPGRSRDAYRRIRG